MNDINFELFNFGLLGFITFELFRIYKKTSAGIKPFPKEKIIMFLHFAVTIGLALISGWIAGSWGNISKLHAFYMGLTFPLSLVALTLNGASISHFDKTESIVVEDTIVGKSSFSAVPCRVFKDYLRLA